MPSGITLLDSETNSYRALGNEIDIVIAKKKAEYGTFKIALSISNVVRDLSLALGVLTGATEAQTAAQMASNVAMAANPVGLVISGIAGLTAGLVLLIKNQKDYSNTLAECNKAMEDANKQSKQIVSDGNVEVSSIQKKAEIYEKLRRPSLSHVFAIK